VVEKGAPSAASASPATARLPNPETEPEHDRVPQSFAEVVALFEKRREAVIRSHLWSHTHLVSFEPGRIEFRPAEGAPRDLANRLGQLLSEWTGIRWMIAVSEAEGEPTLREQEDRRERELRNEVAIHPLVRAVLETFPGATIAAVRERFTASEAEADETPSGDPEEGGNMGEEGA